MKPSTDDWLFQCEETLDTGDTAHIEYDKEGDILEVFFADGSGKGLELADEIVLRYEPKTGNPLSLILLTFSHLIKPTEYGPESFRLSGVEHLPNSERQKVMTMLTSAPVNRFLKVSALALSQDEEQLVPITFVRQQLSAAI